MSGRRLREAKMPVNSLIPLPDSTVQGEGAFELTAGSRILVEPGAEELAAVARLLAEVLRPATGFPLPVLTGHQAPTPGNLVLTTRGSDAALGDEAYELTITPENVRIMAAGPPGAFWGAQTLRQSLPPAVERAEHQPGQWLVPAVTVRDRPRFPWRGLMLDVARHFFGTGEVKHVIDLLAAYKMNRLHLHLTDDQGWRIEIRSWPRLAQVGGSTAVGGGPGGFYTQAEYSEIVAYAQERFVTVVPEIDMPGHTGAALASYAELNGDGVAPPLCGGTEVGQSTLCTGKEITYRFVEDVVREMAALTPGPYLHLGGDEAWSTDPADYAAFVERAQAIVQRHGKQLVGWEEISRTRLLPSSVVQHWMSGLASQAPPQGAKVILSPATRTYLDMKYGASTPLGLEWAGHVEVPDAYAWEPATQVEGVSEGDVLGVEAPLWTETVCSRGDVETMMLPRLIGIAEIGWSPAEGRSWEEYRLRLAAHGPRLEAMGREFYRSPSVPWL
jgi:hexosaminidase